MAGQLNLIDRYIDRSCGSYRRKVLHVIRNAFPLNVKLLFLDESQID